MTGESLRNGGEAPRAWAAQARVVGRDVECQVDVRQALKYLGYGGQRIDAALHKRVERVVGQCEHESRPMWCYRVFPVEVSEGQALLVGSTVRIDVREGEWLTRASGCAVMACTLGLANEVASRRMMALESTDALIFDAAGSSLVESCADACEREVGLWARSWGLHVGQRMSPGYAGLPLSLQGGIVRLLDAGKLLGISVTQGDVLIPLKSITALVGLFERESDARTARYSCESCVVRAGCKYARAGVVCWKR